MTSGREGVDIAVVRFSFWGRFVGRGFLFGFGVDTVTDVGTSEICCITGVVVGTFKVCCITGVVIVMGISGILAITVTESGVIGVSLKLLYNL